MLTAPHLRKLRNFAWTCFRCIYTENVGDVRWTDGMHHICHSCICLKIVFVFVSNWKMYLSENVWDVRGCVAGTDGMHHICHSNVFVSNCICLKFIFVFVSNWKSVFVREYGGCEPCCRNDGMHHICHSTKPYQPLKPSQFPNCSPRAQNQIAILSFCFN